MHYLFSFFPLIDSCFYIPPFCVPGEVGSNDISVNIPSGAKGTIVVFTEPRAFDNSGYAYVSYKTHSPGDFFTVGTTEVCYTWRDLVGSSTDCCFNIIIREL